MLLLHDELCGQPALTEIYCRGKELLQNSLFFAGIMRSRARQVAILLLVTVHGFSREIDVISSAEHLEIQKSFGEQVSGVPSCPHIRGGRRFGSCLGLLCMQPMCTLCNAEV